MTLIIIYFCSIFFITIITNINGLSTLFKKIIRNNIQSNIQEIYEQDVFSSKKDEYLKYIVTWDDGEIPWEINNESDDYDDNNTCFIYYYKHFTPKTSIKKTNDLMTLFENIKNNPNWIDIYNSISKNMYSPDILFEEVQSVIENDNNNEILYIFATLTGLNFLLDIIDQPSITFSIKNPEIEKIQKLEEKKKNTVIMAFFIACSLVLTKHVKTVY